MAISKRELIKLIELLPDEANQSAFDYLKYLSTRHRPDWNEIELMEPDDVPLSEEEERQLKSNSEFMSWEEAMRELNLPTDIKS
jgi:hypothetical protein